MSADTAVHTLSKTWKEFRAGNPDVRIRDAATRLGVSEGELVASQCGDGVTRLRPEFQALLKGVPALGHVMALTRNEHAVIEKQGVYAEASFHGPMGLVLGDAIDLRLFMGHWQHAFAVTENGKAGSRKSLQVFGKDGTAVHKIYVLHDGDGAAYDALVSNLRSDDQGPALAVSPAAPTPAEKPDAQVDTAGLRAAWAALKDTHDFFRLLGQFGVSRTQALRLAAPEMVTPVGKDSHRKVLNSAATNGLPIMVFVGSAGCIEIHTGPVHKVFEANGWFNVLDPDFNLHLREAGVASAFIVRKPTTDGIVTALECYSTDGENIVQFFGKRKPGSPELPAWTALAESLASKK